jgi:hypothetical protein
MIQFQPAQDVKDALQGKKDTTESTAIQSTAPKEPLAMSLDQNPKLAGIFKNTFADTQDSTPAADVTLQSTSDTPSPAADDVTQPTVSAVTEPQEPVAPSDSDRDVPTKSPFTQHDPTDPHGVHDTAHPDDPPSPGVSGIETVAEVKPAASGIVEPQITKITAAVEPEMPTTVPVTDPSPVTSMMPNESFVPFTAFQQRLEAKIREKKANISTHKEKVEKLLTETTAAQDALKSEETEMNQLIALRDLNPETLKSVLSVTQEPTEK